MTTNQCFDPTIMDVDIEQIKDVTEISRRRTVVNACSNYGQYVVTMAVGIFLQAYIIRTLGRNEYAIWPLIITCISFVDLIRVGIGSGAGRFLAHAMGRKDLKEVEQITTSLFAALLAAAVVYTAAIILISIYFEKIFDIPEGAEGIGPWAMLFAGLGGAVALPFGVYQGGLNAAQQFVIINVISVIFLVARLVLIVLAFTLSVPSLILIAGVNLALAIGEDITFFTVARKIVPWQRIRWSAFNWAVLKKVNSFSLLVLVTSVAGLLYWKTDNIIINKLLEPSLLTGYSVVVSFVLYSYQLTSLGSFVLSPIATIMFSNNDLPRIGRLIFRANRILVPLSVPVLFFLIVYGKEILELYIGKQYSSYWVLFPLLAGPAILSVTQASAGAVPQALNKMGLVSLVALLASVTNVLLSIVFVTWFKWGLIGVAAGTAIVMVILRSIWSPWYTSHLLKIPWHRYYWNANVLPLLYCVPALCVMLMCHIIKFPNAITQLIVAFTAAATVHLAFTIKWGIMDVDRKKVMQMLHLRGTKYVRV